MPISIGKIIAVLCLVLNFSVVRADGPYQISTYAACATLGTDLQNAGIKQTMRNILLPNASDYGACFFNHSLLPEFNATKPKVNLYIFREWTEDDYQRFKKRIGLYLYALKFPVPSNLEESARFVWGYFRDTMMPTISSGPGYISYNDLVHIAYRDHAGSYYAQLEINGAIRWNMGWTIQLYTTVLTAGFLQNPDVVKYSEKRACRWLTNRLKQLGRSKLFAYYLYKGDTVRHCYTRKTTTDRRLVAENMLVIPGNPAVLGEEALAEFWLHLESLVERRGFALVRKSRQFWYSGFSFLKDTLLREFSIFGETGTVTVGEWADKVAPYHDYLAKLMTSTMGYLDRTAEGWTLDAIVDVVLNTLPLLLLA